MSKKAKKGSLWLKLLLLVLAAALAAVGYTAWRAFTYVEDVVEEMRPDSAAAVIEEQYKTPPEYEGDVINVLVCGIDSSADRDYKDGDGMTDLIMYVQFDVKNSKISMFQIPRNTFVGGYKIRLENGEVIRSSNANINSIMRRNATTNAEGEEVGNLNALAAIIWEMYRLPVDNYVTINMDALTAMVDAMGGVEVLVPFDMKWDNSELKAGYHTLNGDQVEFFVRNRHGSNGAYAQADIARLNVQRYFYQGLFKKLRQQPPEDLVKLMPVVAYYVTTDLEMTSILQLAIAALSLDSSSFMMCQSPVYMKCDNYGAKVDEATGEVTFGGYSIVVADREKNAELLNEYFRTYTGEVPAEELNIPDYPHQGESTEANVQFMGELDADVNNAIDAGQATMHDVTRVPVNSTASSDAAA